MKYYDGILAVLQNIESASGLLKDLDGERLELTSIYKFYKYLIKHKPSKEERIKISSKCGFQLATLSYLDQRSKFNQVQILQFGMHGRVDRLATLLCPFTTRKNITLVVKDNVSKVLAYLKSLEDKSPKFISTLSYRYIRLFVVFMERGDFAHASIVSKFILNQIFLSEDIDDSVTKKIKELLMNEEEDNKDEVVRSYYSGIKPKKIVRKTAKVAEDVVNKSKDIKEKVESSSIFK